MKGQGVQAVVFTILLAISVSIVVQIFLFTLPPVVDSAATASSEPLENLSATGKTVASFISLLYLVLPMAFIVAVIGGVLLFGLRAGFFK